MKRQYGWKPQLHDKRDQVFSGHRHVASLPNLVDMRKQCPPVFDQGQLGSCTANGIGGAYLFDLMKQKLPVMVPSRLFIYYNERAAEGTIKSDAGAAIRDGIKSIAKQGVCPESMCPYNIADFAKKPSVKAYAEALKHTAVSYKALPKTLDDMMSCLAAGYPFVFGISVYESFESAAVAKTGIVPMPAPDDKLLGGHCVWCVGYDYPKRMFICMNSWGTKWGQKGFFYIPFDYLAGDMASDFWVIQSVSQ